MSGEEKRNEKAARRQRGINQERMTRMLGIDMDKKNDLVKIIMLLFTGLVFTYYFMYIYIH